MHHVRGELLSYEVICCSCRKNLEFMKELGNINSLRKIRIVYFVVKIVIIIYVLMPLKTFLDIEDEGPIV